MKINVDEVQSLNEAIDITVDGVEFKIKKLTGNQIEDAQQCQLNKVDDPLNRQFAFLVGWDYADIKNLNLDVRKVAYAIRVITDSINTSMTAELKKG
jgi:hypothetical protein